MHRVLLSALEIERSQTPIETNPMQTLFLAAIAMIGFSTPLMAMAEPVNVPDGGITVAMLSVAVGGLILLRRKM